MSTGPIDFGDKGIDTMGPTEYGGDPGLVQGQLVGDRSPQSVDHLQHLTTAERRGIMVRARSTESRTVTVDEDGARTEVHEIHATGVDPVTGLDQVNADTEEVTTDSVTPVFGA